MPDKNPDKNPDGTLLTGTIINEMRAARARMEKQGLTEKQIIKKLKVLYHELVAGTAGKGGYMRSADQKEAGWDAGSDY